MFFIGAITSVKNQKQQFSTIFQRKNKMLIIFLLFNFINAREPTAEEKLHEDLLEHYFKGIFFLLCLFSF